jgi:tetratricopeptide (TPR) repeat protein
MDDRLYGFLKYAAIVAALAWAGWSLYDYLGSKEPGDFAYHAGSNYFADGHYTEALKEYEKALTEAPDHLPAKRGRAETLIMLQREHEAITAYQELLELQPDNAGHYANLGIAYDRQGEYEMALRYYETSLAMDSTIQDGPGWLTRFLRNQAEKPSGIAERAGYIKSQLALPERERVLHIPEVDDSQRPYKK